MNFILIRMVKDRRTAAKKIKWRETMKHARSRRGAASALIVLLIVLLVFFGVLAMMTAAADLRLAEKRAEWVKVHFQADQEAEYVLAKMSQLQAQASTTASLEQAVSQLLQDRSDLTLLELYTLDGACYVDVLVYDADRFTQGIQFSVQLQPAGTPSDLRLLSWLQWQPASETADKPGLWEG